MSSFKLPLLAVLSAAMILTVCGTSKTWIKKQVWSSAGCSTAADIIQDNRADSYYVGECLLNQVATAARRRNTIAQNYMKLTCAAGGAFTVKNYNDAACTTGEVQDQAGTTDTCTGSGPDWTKHTCATTSSTIGAVEYGTYSAADCPDDQLNGAGFILINYCEKEEDSAAWDKSEKRVIENGKLKKYQWTSAASQDKDCTGTGTAATGAGSELVLGCQAYDTQWIKISAMLDGADIAGASTFSASSSGVQAPLKMIPVFVAWVLAIGLVFH